MRLFFALWPPRQAAAALHAWAQSVQRAAGGRVTRAETIHLTLAFLGEISEENASRAIQAARLVTCQSHAMVLEEAKFWPRNRIVWAGPLETPAPMAALAAALAAELKARDFRTESRTFKSHVTLIRKAREPGELPPLPAVGWPVDEFALVRSQLSAAGSRYEFVERFALT